MSALILKLLQSGNMPGSNICLKELLKNISSHIGNAPG